MADSADSEPTAVASSPAAAAPSTPKKGKKADSGKKVTNAKIKAEKKPASHPTTAAMVTEAVSKLNEKNGSSLQAIKKYIVDVYKVDADKLAPFIRKFLRSAVEKSILVQTKGKGASGSFKLAVKPKVSKPKSPTEKKPKVKKVVKAKAAASPKPKAKKVVKKSVTTTAVSPKPKAAKKAVPATPKPKAVKKTKSPKPVPKSPVKAKKVVKPVVEKPKKVAPKSKAAKVKLPKTLKTASKPKASPKK